MAKLTEAQIRAQKNYNAKNREQRAYWRDRSAARGFVKNKATNEDLKELEVMIENRKALLKIKELQNDLKGSKYQGAINVFTKQEWLALNLEQNADEDADWVAYADETFADFEDDEPIVEVNANGIPEYFHADDYEGIYNAV
jgi:ribosomal protein L22